MSKANPAIKEATRFVSEHLELLDRVTERLLPKMPKYRVVQRRSWLTMQIEFVPQVISYLGEYDDEATYGYKPLTDHNNQPVSFSSNAVALEAIAAHDRGDMTRVEVVFESVKRAREPSVFEKADSTTPRKKKMPPKKR
ncbi:hypothetical protein EVC12_170 [Rhizobium phage RHph_I42]|nr:hypothetical protein EVC12_170 [Rhizobium phage RHph_I42]